MNERIQDLTNKELQEIIDLYGPITEHNTIAKIIVNLYQEELNERTNS
jgi:16S rRNA C1402 N4-methylase RsmH